MLFLGCRQISHYLQQEFIKTSQTKVIDKKKKWFYSLLLNGNRSDSQHSCKGYLLPSLEEMNQLFWLSKH